MIDGLQFEETFWARIESRYGDQKVWILSRDHLIQNKKASGRLQDLADVEFLESNNAS